MPIRACVSSVTMVTIKMADRCGVLCQHPGCWYSGEKKYETKRKECLGYTQYMDHIMAKTKAKSPPTTYGKLIVPITAYFVVKIH